jgi:hypothetical protein
MWVQSQQKPFDDLKQRFCSALVVSLPNLQQPFEIETGASDYVVSAVLTQHGHLMAYQIWFVSTPLMKNICISLYKPVTNGGIKFS